MLAPSLRGSGIFRRVVSACWCALLLGSNILSIPCGYPSPFGRVTVVMCSMAMLELVQNSWVSVKVRSPRFASLLACAAGTTAGVDDVSAVPPRVRRNTS